MKDLEMEPVFEFTSNSEVETRRLGLAIGGTLIPGMVLGLNGTLGSGKTRLTQAIGARLGIPEGEIVSPTFTICVPHEGRLPILHLDAYRIRQPEEVDELGLDELTEDGVVLIIEWSALIESYLPHIDVEIRILPTGTETRQFRFRANSDRGRRSLVALAEQLSPPQN